jgi:hypothetical protein
MMLNQINGTWLIARSGLSKMKARILQVKIRLHSIVMVIALFLTIIPVNAFAEAPSITLDHANIKPGNQIQISGTSDSNEVMVKVLAPDGPVFYINVVKVNNGHFSDLITIPTNAALGKYQVIVGKNIEVSKTEVGVSTTTSPTPTPSPNNENPGPPSTGGLTGSNSPTPTPTTTPTPTPKPTSKPLVVTMDESTFSKKQETAEDGSILTKFAMDPEKLKHAFEQFKDQGLQTDGLAVIIDLKNTDGAIEIELPGSELSKAAVSVPHLLVTIRSDKVSYSLPLKVLNFALLSQRLGGASADDMIFKVKMASVTSDVYANMIRKAKEAGITVIGPIMEFILTVEANGKKVEINDFGKIYVERTMVTTPPIDSKKMTAALFDPKTGHFTFVPTFFNHQDNERTDAVIKRNGNSIYSIISATKTFDDLNGHWAKADIELLASKLIVNGETASSFVPNDNITRAEFTALLVRSLGLTLDESAASFTDVKKSDWSAGAIGAAFKAGLVDGITDQHFKPNDLITREQMAVMISRAISSTGKAIDVGTGQDQLLDKFKDHALISDWAKTSVTQAIQTGIIVGMTDTMFEPKANASRAQAVVMLKRMLQSVQFIN